MLQMPYLVETYGKFENRFIKRCCFIMFWLDLKPSYLKGTIYEKVYSRVYQYRFFHDFVLAVLQFMLPLKFNSGCSLLFLTSYFLFYSIETLKKLLQCQTVQIQIRKNQVPKNWPKNLGLKMIIIQEICRGGRKQNLKFGPCLMSPILHQLPR